MGNVRFTSRIKQWTDETDRKLDVAILEMATDIHRVSAMLAPKDSRALVNSGKIVRNKPGNYSVQYGVAQYNTLNDGITRTKRTHRLLDTLKKQVIQRLET